MMMASRRARAIRAFRMVERLAMANAQSLSFTSRPALFQRWSRSYRSPQKSCHPLPEVEKLPD